MRRRLSPSDAEQPHLVWNAFVDLLATEGYEDLAPAQRGAHLVFWYESEVQNGGHGQYFENQGVARLDETIRALRELELAGQAEVLSRALQLFQSAPADRDWAEVLPDGLTEELDQQFHQCVPDVTAALERHLASHLTTYVEIA